MKDFDKTEKAYQEKIGHHHYTVLRNKEKDAKRKEFQELWGGGEPDAFAVLARRVYPHPLTGDMRTAGYDEEMADFHGNIGGSHGGVNAAAYLYQFFRQAHFLPTSFVPHTHESPPAPDEPHAEVAEAELMEAGVPQALIEKLPDSFSTLSELLEIIKSSMAEGVSRKHVVVLVNGTQLRRAQAMLDMIDRVGDPRNHRNSQGMPEALARYLEKRNKGEFKVSIVSSEEVLSRVDKHYARLVEKAEQSDIWQRTKKKDDEVADKIYADPENYGRSATSLKP